MGKDGEEYRLTHEGTETLVESIDVSGREDVAKLRRHAVGLAGVLFLTVTGAAPISAMLFNVPLSVGYGNGIYTPGGFLFATIVLTIFSVGYVAMARKKTTAGGFYAFISHGLGRELGMATGLSSVVAYSVFEASLCGGFAFFLNLKIIDWFNVDVPWPFLALGMVVLIAILAYFDVSVSVSVLGVALILEVVALVIFAGGVLFQGGAGSGLSLNHMNPLNAFKDLPGSITGVPGAWAIGVFFAFWSWVGFEMAPNYGEESKDPKRIVPLSLYISVIGLGIFYTLVSWASLEGYATTKAAVAQAQNDPASFFLVPAKALMGGWLREILSILIVTGSFACGMAFHNTAARYFYSLGREGGIVPKFFGKTHDKYSSPHRASTLQSVIAALIVLAFAIFSGTGDPTKQAYLQLYGLMALMGVIIILPVQAIVSVSILVYFERFHKDEVHWWKTRLAPVISAAAQIFVTVLLFQKIAFIGGGEKLANWLGPIDLLVFLIGLGFAFYLKSVKRDKYQAIGRMIQEGL